MAREVRRGGLRCSAWSMVSPWRRWPASANSRDVSALHTAIGEGHVSVKHVVQAVVAELGGIDQAEENSPSGRRHAASPRSTDDVSLVPGALGADLAGYAARRLKWRRKRTKTQAA